MFQTVGVVADDTPCDLHPRVRNEWGQVTTDNKLSTDTMTTEQAGNGSRPLQAPWPLEVPGARTSKSFDEARDDFWVSPTSWHRNAQNGAVDRGETLKADEIYTQEFDPCLCSENRAHSLSPFL